LEDEEDDDEESDAAFVSVAALLDANHLDAGLVLAGTLGPINLRVAS
jgi:hypothetical protein